METRAVQDRIIPKGYKYCPGCETNLLLDNFYNDRSRKDGKTIQCRSCRNKYNKQWREQTIDERKEQSAQYYADNKNKVLETNKKYRNTEKGKEIGRACSLKRRKSGKENIAHKTKRDNDPEFRIKCLLRNRLFYKLKVKNIEKSASTITLTGCSLSYLKQHLESQFIEGMNWDNFGKIKAKENNFPDWWDIDHIKACANFNLIIPEEQQKCFHFTNLQPLWHIDNLKKGKK